MDRPGDTTELLEKVLACRKAVVVLRGPAGCGKTAVALGLYGRSVDEAGRPHCMLLGPNAPAVEALRRRLLAVSPSGVAVAPQVCTFAALGGRILAEAGHGGKMLSPLRRQMLLRRIVRELLKEKKLASLHAVADTPGLVRTLDRAIAELKRAAVEPQALAKVVPPGGDKRRDLLEIYRRYQQRLHEADAYDVEGRMWQARDLLRDARRPYLPGIDALAVDGFTDFTPTQLEMLALLSQRVSRVLITLPYAEDGRARMWHWTQRTLNLIRRAFGDRMQEIEVPAPAAARGLRGLWGSVFQFEAAPCETPKALAIVAAAGVDAEVAAAARRVKRLLVGGAPAGSIAVLARSMEAYREPVGRIFADHDIPIAPPGRTLPEVPIVRFALDAASMAPKFAFRDVLRVLRSSYFRPRALGPFDEATVAAAEMIVREGNVFEGRAAYGAAAQRLAQRKPPPGTEDDDEAVALGSLRLTAKEIAAGGQLLEKLFTLCDGSPLGDILRGLELSIAACSGGSPQHVARDLRALAALEAALAEIGEEDLPVAELRELLTAAACPPARSEALVDVLDVLDARALRYRHVLLLGATESQFPQSMREQALLSEADRRNWAKRGVALDSRQDLTAREMLLFYLAVSRADDTLTLSYLETDASGKPHAPSSFLESLAAPCGGLKAPAVGELTERLAPGEFLPPLGQIAARRDALLAATVGLFGTAPADGAALAWAFREGPQTMARACRGLWARHRRWLGGECNEFDGRIDEPLLRKRLAERYPGGTVFSASQLNAYGQCPWQFFAHYVLKLAELAEPQRRLEAESRGVFCHNVLFRVMTALGARAGGAFRLPDVPESDVLAALEEAVAAEADDVEARRPPYPALWQIQKRQLHEQLKQYLLDQRSGRTLCGTSLHFELGFAMQDRPEDLLDTRSVEEPLELKTPAGVVRVRGKIDRVDRAEVDGEEGLLVIDYKTGQLPSGRDIVAGRNLQLPLYALAARAILAEQPIGGAFHRLAATSGSEERLFGLGKRSGSYRLSEDLEEELDAATATIGRFVAGMRDGRFDALPTHDCPSYCPLRRICEHSPARQRFKSPPGQEDAP